MSTRKGMFADIPVEVGPQFEGQRVRKEQMYVELGGPKVDCKCELVKVKDQSEVVDGEIKVIGPDLKDLKENESYPFAIYIEASGGKIEKDLEGVLERRIHQYSNYIEGLMHLNQRYDIWIRTSKASFKKGMDSFTYWGKILHRLYKAELPIVEKMRVTFITDPQKAKELYAEALSIYEARDARARGMRDEDVDIFYSCVLCQSFAPTHVCIITPNRYANCGAISWFDARASANVDPKGSIIPTPKGECLDPTRGEYTGTNEMVSKRSQGVIQHVSLYSAFGTPHTSCGCFEATAFYVPEVDGLGIVHRSFKDKTVIGLPFSTIADSTAGGRQVDGFHGLSIEYMRSKKFLQADGGWNIVVWLPVELKERVKDAIPKELFELIATEKDVSTPDELRKFLEERHHPIVERWKKVVAVEQPPQAIPQGEEAGPQPTPLEAAPEIYQASAFQTLGGIKVSMEGVKVVVKKAVLRKLEEERTR